METVLKLNLKQDRDHGGKHVNKGINEETTEISKMLIKEEAKYNTAHSYPN
jgi:hypothetical protein